MSRTIMTHVSTQTV